MTSTFECSKKWGDYHGFSGGDSSTVQSQLTNVQTIYSSREAFAALIEQ